MGACCTKDPRDGNVESKEEYLENNVVSERAARPEPVTFAEEAEDDITFKNKAENIKSPKQETNVQIAYYAK